MEPTHDTPTERDAKAQALVVDADQKADALLKVAAVTAEGLAKDMRRFRWETRGYMAFIALLVIMKMT